MESFATESRVLTPHNEVDSLTSLNRQCAVPQQPWMDDRVSFQVNVVTGVDEEICRSFDTAESEGEERGEEEKKKN